MNTQKHHTPAFLVLHVCSFLGLLRLLRLDAPFPKHVRLMSQMIFLNCLMATAAEHDI